MSETEITILKGAQDSENETQKKIREARNKEVRQVYEKSDDKRITEDKRKLGGMRRNEADKKSKINLFLGPRSRVETSFFTKVSKVEKCIQFLKEIFNLLVAEFVKPANITFEQYKLLSRKQKDREFYEQFWRAFSDLARVCKIRFNTEQEWIRDVFIFTMRICEIQRRLLSETLNPVDALNQAKIDKKEQKKQVNIGLGEDAISNMNITVDYEFFQ